MTPTEIWPMISGAAVVVFGAGILVNKIRNGKYVAKEMCHEIHRNADERWVRLEENLKTVQNNIQTLIERD
jgi:hypothetical protein